MFDAVTRDVDANLQEYFQLIAAPLAVPSVSKATYEFPSTGDGGFGSVMISAVVASTDTVAMWESQTGKVAIRDRGSNVVNTFWNDSTNYADPEESPRICV